MWKTNLNILKFQWILFTSVIFVRSQNERLAASDDSITGFFLEKDLSPTLPKNIPEKFINITVEEGAIEFTLQCDEKERRVAWYKDGLKLRPSLRFQINSTGSLRIVGISRDHTGIYRCFVNLLKKAQLIRSYSIQVAYKPVVLSHFAKSVFLTSGQPGHLVCCLSGFPDVLEVMWHQRAVLNAVKDPEQSENNTIEMENISGQPFSVKQLVKSPYNLNDVYCYKKLISYVIPELSGAYTCQGKNILGWGQRSMSFDVFVQVRPYFTQKPDKHPDQQASFPEVLQSCKAEGFPQPEVVWAKFTLNTSKHMKRNISATSEMTKSGDQWLFCPSDSATLCWITEEVELLTKPLKSNQLAGIYACIASNDLGTEIVLSNLVNPEQPSEWQFALGIEVVDSLACGLRIMMEVFTWTPAILPKKVVLEYHECSFSAEFSTSLREKQWRREKISRGSIRKGEFEIRNLASNTLTAVRVYMSCSSSEPVMSNTVYGWSKATANDTKCSPSLTLRERSKSKAVVSVTSPAPEQDTNTPVKVLLACGTLILVLLSILAILLLCRRVRIRIRKRTSSGASYSGPQNTSSWKDGCGESPTIYTTSIPDTITNYHKCDFNLIPKIPITEHGIKRKRQTQNVAVLNNSVEESEILKGATSGFSRASFSPKIEMRELFPVYERSRAATLSKMDITGKNTGWSPTQSHVYTQLPICSVTFTEANFLTHFATPDLHINKSENNDNQFYLATAKKYLPKDAITSQRLMANADQKSFNN